MDDADRADERITLAAEARQRDVQRQAEDMPVGTPGDCDLCGEWSGRLVKGACAPCRDKYKLG